jgi:glycosyltransferase involved in cell wall biosynthesis
MRILIVTNLYPRPGRETIAAFNRRTYRAIADEHEVEIVAPVAWTEKLRDRRAGHKVAWPYTNQDGLRVHHPTFYFTPKLASHQSGRWYEASVGATVRSVARRLRPEVILSAWVHPDGWAANRFARELGIPSVIRAHGSDLLVITGDPWRRARVVEALRGADAIVPVCRALGDRAIELGADPDKVQVVYEGIDLDRFRPGDRAGARRDLGLETDGPLVLFVGNLLWTKGVGVLADAFKLLKDRGIPARGAVVGRGKDEAGIREQIRRLGVEDRLILHGPQPHDQLPTWYHACDLLALPSDSEGLPNVLREAASCGRPYVATRVGGIPEIADPESSVLIEPRSPVQLADAIATLLARQSDPAAIAARSRSISWSESGRQMVEVCRGAIDRASLALAT